MFGCLFLDSIPIHVLVYLKTFFALIHFLQASGPPTTGPRPPPGSVFSFTTIDNHQAVLFGGKQPGHGRVSDCYLMDFKSMVCRSAMCTQHCSISITIHDGNQTCVYNRSGPNYRGQRELPGQRRDQVMPPAASATERSTPSCWSLGEWIGMATHCRMHRSWMSTLGGGGR